MRRAWQHKRHRGFTLVELLIVIIIIGILAGAMMLASFAATDKAKATRIAGEVRTLKAAALLYYNDEDKWPNWDETTTTQGDYVDHVPVFDDYWVGVLEESPDSGTSDRVAVVVKAESLDQGVKNQLVRMARDMSFYGASDVDNWDSPDYYGESGGGEDFLLSFIRPE